MKYVVGQVLYLVFKKDSKVVPALVVEEITRRTKGGVTIDYILQIGPQNQNTTIQLSAVEGEAFSSADVAVETLTKKAKSAIAKLVENASAKARSWYTMESLTQSEQNYESLDDVTSDSSEEEDDVVSVSLPDGTRAKVAMPQRIA